MTISEFLEKLAQGGYRLSNLYQADEGTWFVSIRKKGELEAAYGRDRDLAYALKQAWGRRRMEGVYGEKAQENLQRERLVKKPKIERIKMVKRIR